MFVGNSHGSHSELLKITHPPSQPPNPGPHHFLSQAIVAEHAEDPRWGSHAQRILGGEMWRQPRAGGHDDKAHPPIHPTKHSLVGARRQGGAGANNRHTDPSSMRY